MTQDGLLSTFTLFPNLPPELRIKIWLHSLPRPRSSPIFNVGIVRQKALFYFDGAQPPPIYQACKESRGVALSEYRLLSTSDKPQDRMLTSKLKNLRMILYIPKDEDVVEVLKPE